MFYSLLFNIFFLLAKISFVHAVSAIPVEKEKLPADRQLSETAFSLIDRATIPIEKCSGQFISNEGHFLTALHCLNLRYQTPEMTTKLVIKGHKDPTSALSYWEIENHIPQDLLVRLFPYENSTPGKAKNGLPLSAKVILAGSGCPYRLDSAHSDPELSKVWNNDFIILKFDLPEKTKCVPSAKDDPKIGERLWGVGWPYNKERMFSIGESVSSLGELPLIRAELNDEKLKTINANYINDRVFSTNYKADPGMSGGGVFNENGHLVGVHSFAYGDDMPDGSPGDYVAASVRISLIRESVRNQLGHDEENKIFSCNN